MSVLGEKNGHYVYTLISTGSDKVITLCNNIEKKRMIKQILKKY